MALLTLEHLSFAYPNRQTNTLTDISFSLDPGDFAVLIGETGSGKSTLLRMLKKQLAPRGKKSGRILYQDQPLDALDEKTAAGEIGFVMQNPEQQIVTDKVWHELAFGLENLGLPQELIRRRVAESAAFFGLEDCFDQRTDSLSGGQKQLLNLAAVVAMRPKLLLLDEPTSQLDPLAAAAFLQTLQRLNRELSMTILLIEHRLEDLLPMSSKTIVLESGRLIACRQTRDIAEKLSGHPILSLALPAASRLYAQSKIGAPPCPLTIREGRLFLESHFRNEIKTLPQERYANTAKEILSFRDVFFRYEKKGDDILRGMSFSLYEGEILCLLGGNGSGKSTTLWNACGVLSPYSGKICFDGRELRSYRNRSLCRGGISLLPQDVQTVFLRSTVREELADVSFDQSLFPFDLTPLSERHPYDLSGGEQQLVALAKVMASSPRLLLLDEPTKGLDAFAKKQLMTVLRALKERGMTVLIVTHDVEFAAETADRCAFLFRGEILSADAPNAFFAQNSFYTTAARRMSDGFYDNAVTLRDLLSLCELNGGSPL